MQAAHTLDDLTALKDICNANKEPMSIALGTNLQCGVVADDTTSSGQEGACQWATQVGRTASQIAQLESFASYEASSVKFYSMAVTNNEWRSCPVQHPSFSLLGSQPRTRRVAAIADCVAP